MVEAIVGNFIYQKGDCSLENNNMHRHRTECLYHCECSYKKSKQNLYTEIENLANVTRVH